MRRGFWGPDLCLPAPLLPVSAAELHHPGARGDPGGGERRGLRRALAPADRSRRDRLGAAGAADRDGVADRPQHLALVGIAPAGTGRRGCRSRTRPRFRACASLAGSSAARTWTRSASAWRCARTGRGARPGAGPGSTPRLPGPGSRAAGSRVPAGPSVGVVLSPVWSTSAGSVSSVTRGGGTWS